MYRRKVATWLPIMVVVVLAGCAANPIRQYDTELKGVVTLVSSGAVKQAIEQQERNNGSGPLSQDKDILYYFEKGELLSLDNDYSGGRDAWLKADEVVQVWENEFKTNPQKLLGDIGSFLISDKTRRYDGQDYEKVMLSTQLTLNHVLLGNFDHARIEMKKTYEREKLIESYREKEYDKLKEEGDKKGVRGDLSQLKDYPLAELDTSDVRELKNGFQNAFAHYLAGYFFEVTGESSLAEPGYRNALQLAPHKQIIQSSLKNVGRRKPGARESDVLFVVESGFAPAWKSITIPVPVPRQNGLILTPLSFPVVKSEQPGFVPPSLSVGGRQLPVETLANVDAMARRVLKDQMPGIIVRTIVRAVVKSVAQDGANKASPVLGIIANVAAVVTEQADERSWRTLPERVSVARGILPFGKQTLEFQTGRGTYKTEVDIGSRFAIVRVRLTNGAVYVGQSRFKADGMQSVDTRDASATGAAPEPEQAKPLKKKRRSTP
jgi:hypothetical protein